MPQRRIQFPSSQWSSEAGHLSQVLRRRDELVEGRIPLGIPFLDDALGGLYPDDFLVIGAGTGVGKTALITSIMDAALSLEHEYPVHGMMLEADVGEVTARLGFQRLAQRARQSFDFADFWRGRAREAESEHWAAVMQELEPRLKNLQTYYQRGGDFTPAVLEQMLASIEGKTRLVALDHIHMVEDRGSTDNEVQARTANVLRNFALVHNRPVVAASHLRKRMQGEQRDLVPDKENLLGSKHIQGKATGIVMVARDWDGDRAQPHWSPTFFVIDKDRRGRQVPYIARCHYDMHAGKYVDTYTLGRQRYSKDTRRPVFEKLDHTQVPDWAVNEERKKAATPFRRSAAEDRPF